MNSRKEPFEDRASPIGFILWTLRVIPAQTKFVLAGVVVFAGASLVLGWFRQYSLGVTASAALLIIIFGLVVSALSVAPARYKRGVGGFLAWALAILFILLLSLMLTSTFFGTPPAGAAIVSRLLGSYEPLTRLASSHPPIIVSSDETIALGNLVGGVREEPTEADPFARIKSLAARPELDIRGTLEIGSSDEKRVLAVSTLRLDGGMIVTNGADLTIEVNNLISDNGSIRAFQDPTKARSGHPGRDAGHVVLIVHGTISGRLSINLRGENGANGLAGRDGAKGSKGGKGANAASGLFDCQRGAEGGGTGGRGEQGGAGQDGFTGGRGGVLLVQAVDVPAAERAIGQAVIAGGTGGLGGAGGKGGPGGDGGDGGSPVGLCSGGGPTGPQGERGPDGADGKNGEDGAAGSVRFEQLPVA